MNETAQKRLGVVKRHRTEDIFYSFCITVIWNCFHRRHVDLQLAECMRAIQAENYSWIIGQFAIVMTKVWKTCVAVRVQFNFPCQEKMNQVNRYAWHTTRTQYFNVVITHNPTYTPPRTHLLVVATLMSHRNIMVNKSTYLLHSPSAPFVRFN